MKLIVKALAAAAALTACGVSMAQVTMDANLELNNVFTNKTASSTNSSVDTSGRVEVNLSGKKTVGTNYFVAARGTLGLKTDGTTYVDDAWGQFGSNMWDVKIGRFEAMDLFPVGMDTVVADAKLLDNGDYVLGYQANALRGRLGAGQLHMALGANPMPGVRAELGVVYGNDNGAGRMRGIRPAVSYTTGPLTLRGGIEYVRTLGTNAGADTVGIVNGVVAIVPGAAATSASSSTGIGLSAGYNLAPGSDVNVNFAKMRSRNTLGANVVMGPFGLGAIYARNTDTSRSRYAIYTAYAIPLLDIKGATITPALSVGKNTGSDTQIAANVRLNYGF